MYGIQKKQEVLGVHPVTEVISMFDIEITLPQGWIQLYIFCQVSFKSHVVTPIET